MSPQHLGKLGKGSDVGMAKGTKKGAKGAKKGKKKAKGGKKAR